ncbi:MAG: dTDP-4-dehydrorhamnose 3,5-epimerase [Tumebacillaceae bacterium]
MNVRELALPGAFLIEVEKKEDERGYFARSYCREEFRDHGLNPDLAQCNISYNHKKGTLRGLHYQAAPYEEAKLVRCTRGSIYDVIVDIRPDSPAYCQWVAVELSAERNNMLYIPEGFAHGFQTLTDGAEVFYQISQMYDAGSARGIRYDDPAFGVKWHEVGIEVISERDLLFPRFER